MGSFGIGEWVIALLIVAVILGTRKLVSSLAARAGALSDRGVVLGVESAWPVFVHAHKSGKHDPLDAPAGMSSVIVPAPRRNGSETSRP